LTRSNPFWTTCSAISVSSRGVRSRPISANEATGWSFSVSARVTIGSLASRGKLARICASLSRTSCIARVVSTSRRNSTQVSDRPSSERDRIRFTPATVFTAFSTGLARSFSTCSGDAPG
jgi:hypothetical protein